MHRILLLICLVVLTAAPAAAVPDYSINYWNGGAWIPGPTSSAPLFDSRSYGLAPSNGTGTFTGGAYCGPGYVDATGRVDCTWVGSGSFVGRVDAHAATTDAVVTGPPGQVIGTLNVRVRVDLSRDGGYPDNNGTYASFEFGLNTPYMGTVSDLVSGNHSTYGTGVFTGITSPHVDMVIPFTGTFTTNAPFNLTLNGYCAGATYGGPGFNPGLAECAAVVRLEMVNGQVMTLPAGYSFQIPGWGITNNTYAGAADAADGPAASGVELSLAGPNPASGDTRLALTLPRDSRAGVVVYDIAGRTVRELVNGWQTAGRHELAWDGRNDGGARAAAGVYIVHADVGGHPLALRVVRAG